MWLAFVAVASVSHFGSVGADDGQWRVGHILVADAGEEIPPKWWQRWPILKPADGCLAARTRFIFFFDYL